MKIEIINFILHQTNIAFPRHVCYYMQLNIRRYSFIIIHAHVTVWSFIHISVRTYIRMSAHINANVRRTSDCQFVHMSICSLSAHTSLPLSLSPFQSPSSLLCFRLSSVPLSLLHSLKLSYPPYPPPPPIMQ